MSTPSSPRSVVAALVDRGLVAPEHTAEAVSVVTPLLAGPETGAPGATPVRRRLAEVAGYVGAAFVVGAAILFLSTTWADLGVGTQVVLLLGSALVLGGAGTGVVLTAAATAGARRADAAGAVRRRLASVLLTGAAGCAAFGVGVATAETSASAEVVVLVAAATALVLALAGYRWAPSVVGQLGAAAAAVTMLPSGLGALESDTQSIVPLAVGFLALGGSWLLAAARGWWREGEAARVVGCLLALVGAQLPVMAGDQAWVGYLLTAAVALASFGGYLASRAWPLLAAGVGALTLVVPEALHDAFGDSLGAAGVLLAAGVTLLGAALLGLRLRREVVQA
ncbi:MAG TPA: hypothetical protein VFV40_02965 [Nocardioides sp.]|nr:hypothetical protein [Nocardioides sp.]